VNVKHFDPSRPHSVSKAYDREKGCSIAVSVMQDGFDLLALTEEQEAELLELRAREAPPAVDEEGDETVMGRSLVDRLRELGIYRDRPVELGIADSGRGKRRRSQREASDAA
jgi:hypothetical protein